METIIDKLTSGENTVCEVYNCQSIINSALPLLSIDNFRTSLIELFQENCSISSLYANPSDKGFKVYAVISDPRSSLIRIISTEVNKSDGWESLARIVPAVHMFEREMAEQRGITLLNHPWPKPVRYHSTFNGISGSDVLPGVTDFYKVNGEEVHEVAVGPVHAGIIEPGHFRFQCHGEVVFHLEIALGFQHRGIEKRLVGSPDKRTVYYMENAAGDTAIGHTLAYCQIIESLCGISVSARAEALRGIALELERLANHTGDLGALAGDVGYLPTAAYCGRLRGDFLNMTALLCGSRFGRGFIRPGGVTFGVDGKRVNELTDRLRRTFRDVKNAVSLLLETPSVLARFEGTGKLSETTGRELGLVGPAVRSCGLTSDIRQDFPSGIFQFFNIPVSTWHTGDVFARAYVRWLEIQHSVEFIEELLKALPEGELLTTPDDLRKNSTVVSLVEGWRGEICHIATTGNDGKFTSYKITDPSFHNWTGLAMALRDQQISDFPLCNKSFNLSYCGHDL